MQLVGNLIQTYLVGILLGYHGTDYIFHHLRVRIEHLTVAQKFTHTEQENATVKIHFRTSIGLYSFYIYTKTAPEYQAVEKRYKLMYTHKFAAKNPGFNIDDFNEKMRKLANLNENLLRLRDPLRLQLPIRQIRHSSTVDLY